MSKNNTITRRSFIKTCASLTVGVPISTFASTKIVNSSSPLKDIANKSGRNFGSTIYTKFRDGKAGSFEDKSYRDLLIEQCGIVVPENELKWDRVQHDNADSHDFSYSDKIVKFAKDNKMSVRGHCLIWQNQRRMPRWLSNYNFGNRSSAECTRLIDRRIDTVCNRYGNDIMSYDVINEAVDNKTGVLRRTNLSEAMGGAVPLLDEAFRIAHEKAPNAELVYNDFMNWQVESKNHRYGVLKLLEGFRKRDVPVNTLGCQSHLFAGGQGMAQGATIAQPQQWNTFIKEVTDLGYKIAITELDVIDRWLPANLTRRDTISAELVREYLDIMLSFNKVQDVICWDLVNRYSYLQNEERRTDRLPARPCPYDDDYKSTAIRKAIASSLINATSVTRN